MPSYIGIDLGTTFSAVSTLDETGRPVIVHNSDGENITPSCVLVEGSQMTVGEDARRQWGISPGNVGARFKRDMGTDTRYQISGSNFTPMDFSSAVLKKIKNDTERSIGPIAEAVVTIPANFSNEAREATLQAAKDAGLNVNFIINEPTAAALYYAFKSGKDLQGLYAVYDFGGGTFDVSIIRVAGQDIEVLASHGVSKLGGDDFDGALQKIVADKYKLLTGNDLDLIDYSKNSAEEDKKSLSKRDRVSTRVAQQIIQIDRSDFETAISRFVAQAEMLCESAMDEAGISPPNLSGVFLVGGSTRVPAIKASVTRVFGMEPLSTVNVDEVVALGAALYAAYKSDRTHLSSAQKASVSSIKFSEITNFCFGTIVSRFDQGRSKDIEANAVMINKNEKIPCTVTKSFYTVFDGQESVRCVVTQSVAPESDPRFVKTIWEGNLSLPPGRPSNQEIQVTFGFDANNVMTCKFVDVATRKEVAVDLRTEAQGSKSANVDKFLVD